MREVIQGTCACRTKGDSPALSIKTTRCAGYSTPTSARADPTVPTDPSCRTPQLAFLLVQEEPDGRMGCFDDALIRHGTTNAIFPGLDADVMWVGRNMAITHDRLTHGRINPLTIGSVGRCPWPPPSEVICTMTLLLARDPPGLLHFLRSEVMKVGKDHRCGRRNGNTATPNSPTRFEMNTRRIKTLFC